MVEPLHRRAAADVALRLVSPRRAEVVGRRVALGLVVELEDVPVGIREAVGRAVAEIAVDPAEAATGRLDRRRPAAPAPPGSTRAARGGRAPRAATRSASGCSGGSPPSRGGRPTAPRAPPPRSRARRRRSAGSRPASVSAARHGRSGRRRGEARSSFDEPPEAVEVVGERARLELRALLALTLGPPPRRREHLLDALDSTTTAPSASRTTMSPWRTVAPPAVTGSPIAPGMRFSAPRTRTQRAQIGSPSSRSSSRSRTAASTSSAATPRAFACVASSSPTSATGADSGIVSTSTSPGHASATAACTMRLSSWPQRTVRAGPAAREPGTTWTRGTSTTGDRPAASWTVAVPSRASSANASVTARSRPAE